MNELEKRWESMKLTEEESKCIDLDDEIPEELKNKEDCSLVGKVWVERSISRMVIENTMAKVWRISRKAQFQEVGTNMFVMTFANQADKLRILQGRPWLFDNQMFVIMQLNGSIPPQKMDFSRERMWIQLHNLPLACMNKDRGVVMGETIGRVLEVETLVDGSGWGSFLRILTELDLKKPLARGRTITIKGQVLWIPVKYEKLPHFCFRCGCIIHDEVGCRGKDGEEIQFGAWMRAGVRAKFQKQGESRWSPTRNGVSIERGESAAIMKVKEVPQEQTVDKGGVETDSGFEQGREIGQETKGSEREESNLGSSPTFKGVKDITIESQETLSEEGREERSSLREEVENSIRETRGRGKTIGAWKRRAREQGDKTISHSVSSLSKRLFSPTVVGKEEVRGRKRQKSTSCEVLEESQLLVEAGGQPHQSL
ncbi:hypothetical protein F2P56_004583 [Juglans regia]|uniref:Uncharacterized protein LOC108986122 n=3 Tax=Juglans regia TaxID=51240 RepID=A0A2I4E460_JUGRE|nr:uncharacterized protein LOC108986122 [Juglans regia]XP_035545091.1 uncharacterized protein LOC118348183 [Juglans regia]KAF5472196.1 hypothetical protein F2P56_008933 [Juglans regia]KAF5477983.1 hypothetical protein F2P56_004583 [Juglans regia]